MRAKPAKQADGADSVGYVRIHRDLRDRANIDSAKEWNGLDTHCAAGVSMRGPEFGERLGAARTIGNHCGRARAHHIVAQVTQRAEESDVNDSLRLYLIRHGETAWSLTGQHTGCSDIPLTPRGEQQARELEPWLRKIGFSRVLSSPALRAWQTCELAAGGYKVDIEANLMEWNYGDYEGKGTSEIQQERPEWDIWSDGCPHGETPADVCERADKLIGRLRMMRGSVALFSHGQFGCALAVRWVEMPVISARHFVLAPAAVSILTHDAGPAKSPVISLWNAVSSGL
jgi:broad specificity phosphatase PhoE